MKIRYWILFIIGITGFSGFAQVLSNGAVTPIITAQNPFLDASTNFDLSVTSDSSGKGLVFQEQI